MRWDCPGRPLSVSLHGRIMTAISRAEGQAAKRWMPCAGRCGRQVFGLPGTVVSCTGCQRAVKAAAAVQPADPFAGIDEAAVASAAAALPRRLAR